MNSSRPGFCGTGLRSTCGSFHQRQVGEDPDDSFPVMSSFPTSSVTRGPEFTEDGGMLLGMLETLCVKVGDLLIWHNG